MGTRRAGRLHWLWHGAPWRQDGAGLDRTVETHIYNTLPHHLGRLLKRHPPRCPVGFVAGQRSKEMRVGDLAATTALAGLRQRWIDGTHLYPMEKPAQTEALVLELLGSMA